MDMPQNVYDIWQFQNFDKVLFSNTSRPTRLAYHVGQLDPHDTWAP